MSEKLAAGLVFALGLTLALGLVGLIIQGIARLVRKLAGRGLGRPSC